MLEVTIEVMILGTIEVMTEVTIEVMTEVTIEVIDLMLTFCVVLLTER